MEHPEFDKSLRSSIRLWWSEGKVVGAAIYDMYFGEAFCGALPEYEALYPEILDYAYRELKDDSGLAVAINTENTAEIRAAELAGFERIDQKETIMELSLDRDFSSNLPEGLQLREQPFVAQGIARVPDAETVSLNHILQAGIQAGLRILIEKFMRRGNSVHCDITYAAAFSVVQPEASVPRNPVRKYGLPVCSGKDKYRLRTAARPDLPCRMIDMIRMIMRPQEDADAVHPCCRDRRGNLPVQDI